MPAVIKSTTVSEIGTAGYFVALTLADGKGGSDTKNTLDLRMTLPRNTDDPNVIDLQMWALENAAYHIAEEIKRLEGLPRRLRPRG